jgi:hypothetical protein
MSQYADALEAMHYLLTHVGVGHWADWIARDIREWRESRGVKHHLSAYGGMGSFNDVYPLGEPADTVFKHLQLVCWLLAKNRGQDMDEPALLSAFQQGALSGWQCRGCGYAQTSVGALESHLEAWHVPRLIVRSVTAGATTEFVTDLLAGRMPVIDQDRTELLARCQRAHVAVTPGPEPRRCPACGGGDTVAMLWLTVGELIPLPPVPPQRHRPKGEPR